MADKNYLEITERTEFGKGASRRIRRDGGMPVVVYGHESDTKHYVVNYHDAYLMVRGNPNALLTLKSDSAEQLVMVKDIQRNPLTRVIEHLDLLRVNANEKVDVDVTVEVQGEPAADAIATVENMTLAVKAPVSQIPDSIVVDVEGLEDGTVVTVADLKLPSGVTTEIDPAEVVVVVAVPQLAELPEEGGEAEADSAEAAAEETASDAE